MRKQQDELEAELVTTQNLNAKLNNMVDKSSVEAVDRARAERDQTIRDKDNSIKAAQSQVAQAHQKQKEAENEASNAANTLKRNSFLYIGLLAFTLLCQCIINPQVVADFINFFKVPVVSAFSCMIEYIEWLIDLSNKIYLWLAWVLRILLTLIIIAIIIGIIMIIIHLIDWYKKRWCTLSLKVAVCTISIISVFGVNIRRFLPINLILLFIIVQVCYLFVLLYFDKYYTKHYKTDKWKKIQNH